MTVCLVSKDGSVSHPVEVAVLQAMHARKRGHSEEFRDLASEMFDAAVSLETKLEFVTRFFLAIAMTSGYAAFHSPRASEEVARIRKRFILDTRVEPISVIEMHKSNAMLRNKADTFHQKVENSSERIQISLTVFDNLQTLADMCLKKELIVDRNERGNRNRIFSEEVDCIMYPDAKLKTSFEKRPNRLSKARPFVLVNEIMLSDNLKEQSIDEEDPQRRLEMQIKLEQPDDYSFFTDTNVSFKARKFTDKTNESVELELAPAAEAPEVEKLYSIAKRMRKCFVAEARKLRETPAAPGKFRKFIGFN